MQLLRHRCSSWYSYIRHRKHLLGPLPQQPAASHWGSHTSPSLPATQHRATGQRSPFFLSEITYQSNGLMNYHLTGPRSFCSPRNHLSEQWIHIYYHSTGQRTTFSFRNHLPEQWIHILPFNRSKKLFSFRNHLREQRIHMLPFNRSKTST